MITVRTLTGPVYWASALINGDYSGLSTEEAARCDAWLKSELEPGESIVSTTPDDAEGRFTWSFDLHGGECAGGEVIDYTVLNTKD
jgi:hypothetical protein